MVIIDIDGNVIGSPDFDLGKIVPESKNVVHEWVIDVQEESHEEVIAEYPETGGKDVETVVDVEEQGHWKTIDESGKEIEHFDGLIPDDLPHETQHQDVWSFYRYVPYTAEELEEIAKRKAEAEAEAKKREERESFLTEAPERIGDAESALAELGGMGSANTATIEELQQAVAELGAIVAAQ